MPGRQRVTTYGLEFQVGPKYWLRRLTRFPFYFENNNPSFRVEVKRVQAPRIEGEELGAELIFNVQFSDGTSRSYDVPFPKLEVGDSAILVLSDVYTPQPGQNTIRLSVRRGVHGTAAERLYSYHVRTEEQLWLWLVGAPLALAVIVLGAIVQKSLGLL